MPRQRLLELCDALQNELTGEASVDDETQEALGHLVTDIRQALAEESPGQSTDRLVKEVDTVAQGLDPVRFPGARLLGDIAEKLSEMGI